MKLRGITSGCVALATAAFLAVGCGDSAETDGGNGGKANAGEQLTATTPAPKADIDRVTWNLPADEPASLDPITTYNDSPNTVLSNMCESLLRLKPDFSIAPALATRYSNPDPRTWVYELRDDVTFWNGEPMTAEDVAFSIGRNLSANSYWNLWYTNVAGVDVTGKNEVTVRLKRPDYLFNQFMATAAAAISDKETVEQKGRAYGTAKGGLMCTGPFEFVEWAPKRSITMRRNEAYWDPELKARAGEVEFKFISDSQTLSNALDSGQVDGSYIRELDVIPALRESSAGKLYFGPGFRSEFLAPLGSDGPLGDPRIRKALSLAIDRKAISQTIFNGAAEPLRALAPRATWGYARDTFEQAYEDGLPIDVDIEQAKQLVKEAGSPKEQIVLAAEALGLQVQLGTAIADAAKQIGLNVKLKSLPSTQYNDIYFSPDTRKQYDAFLQPEYQDVAEPLEPYTYTALPGSLYNYFGYDNPQVTKLIGKARATEDEQQRAATVVEIQRLMDEELPLIPLVGFDSVVFMNEKITGAPASFVYLYYPWAAELGAS